MTAVGRLARAVRRLARPLADDEAAPQRESCRLYEQGAGRIEAHLESQRDGRVVVVAVPVEGAGSTSWYRVDERDPWRDFERQAGVEGAHWGPCRAPSAGI